MLFFALLDQMSWVSFCLFSLACTGGATQNMNQSACSQITNTTHLKLTIDPTVISLTTPCQLDIEQYKGTGEIVLGAGYNIKCTGDTKTPTHIKLGFDVKLGNKKVGALLKGEGLSCFVQSDNPSFTDEPAYHMRLKDAQGQFMPKSMLIRKQM